MVLCLKAWIPVRDPWRMNSDDTKCTQTARIVIDGYHVLIACEQPHSPGELHTTYAVGRWNDSGEIVRHL